MLLQVMVLQEVVQAGGQCGHFYFYIVGKCFNYMRHFMNNQFLISE